MFPFHTPWKHQKTFGFSGFFRGYEMGILTRNGVNWKSSKCIIIISFSIFISYFTFLYYFLLYVGTFNNNTGLHNSSSCSPCSAGFYCPNSGTVVPTLNCFSGYWCKSGSVNAVPVGQPYGDVCPKGAWCPRGTTKPILCPAGTYQPLEKQKEFGNCLGNFFLEILLYLFW